MIPELPPFSIQCSQQLTQHEDLPGKKLVTAKVHIPFIRDTQMNVPPKFLRASSLVASIQNIVTNVEVGNKFVKISTRKEQSTITSITIKYAFSANLEI